MRCLLWRMKNRTSLIQLAVIIRVLKAGTLQKPKKINKTYFSLSYTFEQFQQIKLGNKLTFPNTSAYYMSDTCICEEEKKCQIEARVQPSFLSG